MPIAIPTPKRLEEMPLETLARGLKRGLFPERVKLEEEFPNLAGKIRTLRERGFEDEEIFSAIALYMARLKEEGLTDEEILQRVGGEKEPLIEKIGRWIGEFALFIPAFKVVGAPARLLARAPIVRRLGEEVLKGAMALPTYTTYRELMEWERIPEEEALLLQAALGGVLGLPIGRLIRRVRRPRKAPLPPVRREVLEELMKEAPPLRIIEPRLPPTKPARRLLEIKPPAPPPAIREEALVPKTISRLEFEEAERAFEELTPIIERFMTERLYVGAPEIRLIPPPIKRIPLKKKPPIKRIRPREEPIREFEEPLEKLYSPKLIKKAEKEVKKDFLRRIKDIAEGIAPTELKEEYIEAVPPFLGRSVARGGVRADELASAIGMTETELYEMLKTIFK